MQATTDAFLLCRLAQVDMLQAPTAPPTPGDTCCTPPPAAASSAAIVHPPSPLEKDFEGVRDVNVSVALMEEFMQCAAVHHSGHSSFAQPLNIKLVVWRLECGTAAKCPGSFAILSRTRWI